MISPTLLITDDDAGFRETMQQVFEPEGYRTVLAENGREALDIVLAVPIHLVLIDMHMPMMNGVETIRQARKHRPELPFILLSAALDELVIKEACEVYVYSVLAKPCSKKQITSLVRDAISSIYP